MGEMFGICIVLHLTVEIISDKMFHTLFSAKQKREENVNYVSKIRYLNSPRLKQSIFNPIAAKFLFFHNLTLSVKFGNRLCCCQAEEKPAY